MNILTGIKKQKKKKILTMSASGQNKGLQTLYIELNGKDWIISDERVIKYPDELSKHINNCKNEESKCSIKKLAELDLLFSDFLVSTAKEILSTMPLGRKKPDFIILNKLSLWTGPVIYKEKPHDWSFTLGNPSFLATKTGFPVISDFIEHTVVEKQHFFLPILNGDIQIGTKINGPSLFVNLGLNSRLTLIEATGNSVLIDCECGPGTSVIDMVAEKIGLNQGFDRDGNEAQNGEPDTTVIEYLQEKVKENNDNFENKFKKLLNTSKMSKLSNQDLLSTTTAFVALTIFDTFRNEYTAQDRPETLWISGGGTNNLALVSFLKSYFAPIEVKNVEELGITSNNRLPLSLALTVNSWIEGEDIVLPPEIKGPIKNIGTWYMP